MQIYNCAKPNALEVRPDMYLIHLKEINDLTEHFKQMTTKCIKFQTDMMDTVEKDEMRWIASLQSLLDEDTKRMEAFKIKYFIDNTDIIEYGIELFNDPHRNSLFAQHTHIFDKINQFTGLVHGLSFKLELPFWRSDFEYRENLLEKFKVKKNRKLISKKQNELRGKIDQAYSDAFKALNHNEAGSLSDTVKTLITALADVKLIADNIRQFILNMKNVVDALTNNPFPVTESLGKKVTGYMESIQEDLKKGLAKFEDPVWLNSVKTPISNIKKILEKSNDAQKSLPEDLQRFFSEPPKKKSFRLCCGKD